MSNIPEGRKLFERRLISFIPGDLDTIKTHFPDKPYNAIVRTLVHQYANGLRSGHIERIEFNPNQLDI